MADTKLSALTALTGANVDATNDLLYIDDVSVTTGKKITVAELAIALSFPAGTRAGFQQTAAPTGWTKDTTAALNDSVMRIVTGTASSGGADAFSTLFGTAKTTASYALQIADIPSHTHAQESDTLINNAAGALTGGAAFTYGTGGTTGAAGGGGGHSHTLSNMNLKYYDWIVASKN